MSFRTATRRFRKYLIAGMMAGRYALKLVGSAKVGFVLCIERIAEFGKPTLFQLCEFDRQKDAVAYSETKFRRTPEKVTVKLAAAA